MKKNDRKVTKGEGVTPKIVGSSETIRRVRRTIERVGPRESNVLIQGESGTGKELVARHIHNTVMGDNEPGPFCAINCSAINDELMASELFGHHKGAFTGAHTDRKGLFREATDGTLFLDEVGEISSAGQAKLLRALEEGRIRPVGSDETVAADPRIISATNRDLEAGVDEGDFREDLYYRLDVIKIEIPPLRERREDIPELARFLIDKIARRYDLGELEPTSGFIQSLIAFDWPGNVRQLENRIEQAVIFSDGNELDEEALPGNGATWNVRNWEEAGLQEAVNDFERALIRETLEQNDGNKRQTARELGISRSTLYRKLFGSYRD